MWGEEDKEKNIKKRGRIGQRMVKKRRRQKYKKPHYSHWLYLSHFRKTFDLICLYRNGLNP